MLRTTYDDKKRIWYGRQLMPLYSTGVSIGQIVLEILSRNPNKIGQINHSTGIQLKNNDIRLKSIRFAQNLLKCGFSEDDVVCVYARNYDETASVVFGSWLIGLIINPLAPYYKKNEIVHMFSITRPAVVFCENENAAVLKEALCQLGIQIPVYIFGQPLDGTMRSVSELLVPSGTEEYFIPTPIRDSTKRIAFIHSSSGTTGLPKAVSISHAAFLSNNNLAICHSEDVTLNYSPLYWISGSMMLLGGTMAGTTRIFSTELFSPELMLDMIEKYKVTMVITPPSYLAQILDHPKIATTNCSSLRLYFCGGSYVDKSLQQRMLKHMPNGEIQIIYGQTEMAGITHRSNQWSVPDSVGKNSNLYAVKIVDIAGNKCGINEEGEICMKSYYPFLGYYNQENETKAVMDDEGFIRSGDIGKYNENGDLFIIDRKKDILKYRNNQISPSEIEGIIMKISGILHVCVVGIPDSAADELPTAIIVKKDNVNIVENDIQLHVKENLSDSKQLRGGVFFVENLPFNQSGKVIRGTAKDIAIELYRKKKQL